MSRPDISVVIPARNEAKNIAPTVMAISRARTTDARVEFVIVDDASTDATMADLSGLGAGTAPGAAESTSKLTGLKSTPEFIALAITRHPWPPGKSSSARTLTCGSQRAGTN